MNTIRPVYAIALHDGGRFPRETWETISFAREISGGAPVLIVPAGGESCEPLARKLACKTGLEVVGLAGVQLEHYSAEGYVEHLASFLEDAGPAYVCIPHTARGSDFAPQLSARLDSCCITSIEALGDGSFVRSMFGGKFRAHHRPEGPSAVLTVMPGAWRPGREEAGRAGGVRIVRVPDGPGQTRYHGTRESAHKNMALSAADVVVSAGRGVGKAENLSNIRALAALFPKSAIGSTRAVCDLGWLDYTHQIGSTGNRVSPRLYIACGISGAIQHLAGMKDSRMVIAINTDRQASIFGIARYGIVEDVNTFIPLVIDALKKGSGRG